MPFRNTVSSVFGLILFIILAAVYRGSVPDTRPLPASHQKNIDFTKHEFKTDFDTFPYTLGGTTCACKDAWSVAAYWDTIFLDNFNNDLVPYTMSAMLLYLFSQSTAFTFFAIYMNESIEEVILMFTGTWGWTGKTDHAYIETRYDSLIKDTLVCGTLGILLGQTILNKAGRFPIIHKPTNWKSWDIANPASAARLLVILFEYFGLTLVWASWANPTKQWDVQNTFALYTAFAMPLAIWTVYYMNKNMRILEDVNEIRAWYAIHVYWSITVFVLALTAYIAPFPGLFLILLPVPAIIAAIRFSPGFVTIDIQNAVVEDGKLATYCDTTTSITPVSSQVIAQAVDRQHNKPKENMEL